MLREKQNTCRPNSNGTVVNEKWHIQLKLLVQIRLCTIPSRPTQQRQREPSRRENRLRVHICVHVFSPDTCTSGDLSASAKENEQQIEDTDLAREGRQYRPELSIFLYLCRDKEKRAEEPPEYPIENYAAISATLIDKADQYENKVCSKSYQAIKISHPLNSIRMVISDVSRGKRWINNFKNWRVRKRFQTIQCQQAGFSPE
jgi:hypothetical protein